MSGHLESELNDIETRLDELNGEFGDHDQYCIFCKSTDYNGAVGIVHKKYCVILQLRTKIKEIQ